MTSEQDMPMSDSLGTKQAICSYTHIADFKLSYDQCFFLHTYEKLPIHGLWRSKQCRPHSTYLDTPISLIDGLRGAVPGKQCPESTAILCIGNLASIADLPHQVVHSMPGDRVGAGRWQILEHILEQVDGNLAQKEHT